MRSLILTLLSLTACSRLTSDADKGDTDTGFNRHTDEFGLDTDLTDTDVLDTDGALDTDVQDTDTGPCAGVATTLVGDVTLSSPADIATLRCVKRITGVLYVDGTQVSFASLSGLESLEIVDSTVSIYGDVASLSGLDGLTQIGGSLIVNANPSLTSFDGLDALASTRGFGIQDNDALTSFSGLGSLTRVGSVSAIHNVSLCNSVLTSFAQRFREFCFCQYNKPGC